MLSILRRLENFNIRINARSRKDWQMGVWNHVINDLRISREFAHEFRRFFVPHENVTAVPAGGYVFVAAHERDAFKERARVFPPFVLFCAPLVSFLQFVH